MTEPLEAADTNAATRPPAVASIPAPGLAEDLLAVVNAVAGVSAVYPSQPLWQSIAGAAMSAVTGDAVPLIGVTESKGALSVKARIGVSAPHPAPAVAREVAAAVRRHLLPRRAAVDVSVVQMGQ
ncbi:hypothetical protein [Paenarthrobacter ilicis]|uniref:hypothetical protein n=1 Tax=Paenarthrobacter ilicis TaxID=43665 RepID=UPI0028D562CF|nr:hypothetical protein [Paenarthrobacter ilicis]